MKKLYKIAVNTPFNNSILTYSSNEEFTKGNIVEVPLGKNRLEKGCVLGEVPETSEIDRSKIKDINGVLENSHSLDPLYVDTLAWVANYYHYPLGQHIFDVLPKFMKRPKKTEPIRGKGLDFDYELTEEQMSALETIRPKLGGFSRFLLHGVTGSGKTTVYIKLIKEVMEKGKNVLFLIPEINLTPQFLKVLEESVSGRILSYHSSVTPSEKFHVWNVINEGSETFIMIGVRSSIFLPYKNLGLIIVDEEHDTSFKQEDRCPYHARDVAMKIASDQNIPIVLGSATPTVETYYQAQEKRMDYIRMANRPKSLQLPVIDIIDARSNGKKREEHKWPFSDEGLKRVEEKITGNEQVLVFVNRLGFASFVQCGSCGQGFDCPNCSSNLKYFKRTNSLNCSFCEYKIPFPESCPSCGNLKLLQKGFGTERLQEVLENNLEHTKIDRFDRDNIKNFEELKNILKRFEDKEIDVLVGTQMLSKGHNFNSVNLVVVLGIDAQLNFPDFRSNERVFQLMTQVAGRPGRSDKQGHVQIETLSPENKIFELVKDYRWQEFYEEEFQIRSILGYPPFSRLCCLYFSYMFQQRAKEAAQQAAHFFNSTKSEHFESLEVLGPKPLFIEKRANKFTWSILLKTNKINDLHNAVGNLKRNIRYHQSVSFKIDIDPQHLS